MCMFESGIEKSKYLLSSKTDADEVLPNDINKNHALIIIYNPITDELNDKIFL